MPLAWCAPLLPFLAPSPSAFRLYRSTKRRAKRRPYAIYIAAPIWRIGSWIAQPTPGIAHEAAAITLITVPQMNCEICSAVISGATRARGGGSAST